MKKKNKLTGMLGCIAGVAVFAAVYCLMRAQNPTLLTIGIIAVIIAIVSLGICIIAFKKFYKDKYK